MSGEPAGSGGTRFVALDLETTGLIPGLDRIVEIGAVAFDTDGEVQAEFSALVDPGIPIPREASRVNGIYDRDVSGCPPIAEALPRLLAFLGDAVPVAHNAPFDLGFLAADLARLGLRGPSTPVIDTRGLARLALPGRASYSMEALCRELGIREGSAHRALADADSCRRLLLACLSRLPESRDRSPADLAALAGPAIDLADRSPALASRVVALKRALDAGADVQIAYDSAKGERTLRRIAPRAFVVQGGSPAVVAFCRLRNQQRTFLVESIREVRPL